MKRKDCDNPKRANDRTGEGQRRHAAWAAWFGVGVLACTPPAQAGAVRLWPAAVVVDDAVRLSDLCELTGFDAETEQTLNALVVTPAPPAGGSRIVHLEMIRAVLGDGGANMAEVTVRGATECAVTRPSAPVTTSSGISRVEKSLADGGRAHDTSSRIAERTESTPPSTKTLRQAVVQYFDDEFERYGGTADVVFDRTSKQVLDLSGPPYEFKVRRRGGSPLGLTALEVDVLVDDRIVQAVSLVVQVTMTRRALVARRAISQGAAIRASDVAIRPISFSRLDKMGLDDPVLAIGQRAKRFIQAGTLLEPVMLESVPLVQRGELVTLVASAGGIRIVTTARATENGHLHEVVKVQAQDNRRVEYDAVVVGLGEVQIGGAPPRMAGPAVALGGQP